MRLPFTTAMILLAAPAFADDLPGVCAKMLDEGRAVEAKEIAKTLIGGPLDLEQEQIRNAERCVSAYMAGSEYVYVPAERGFQSPDAVKRHALAAAEAKEAGAETERRKAEIESLRDSLARSAQQSMEREAKVTARLYDACARQYRHNSDETIMNKLCFDMFMDEGLPE